MKDFFSKHWVAVLSLVLAILIVVPLSAGISLNIKSNKCFSSFEKSAVKNQGHGQTLSSDMDTLIAAASNCLDAAERMLGDDDYSVKNARDAIKDYKSLKRQHLRYKACLDVCRLIDVVYSACGGENADDITIVAQYNQMLSSKAKIFNYANVDYESAKQKQAKLLSGFPAKYIAEFFNIGE